MVFTQLEFQAGETEHTFHGICFFPFKKRSFFRITFVLYYYNNFVSFINQLSPIGGTLGRVFARGFILGRGENECRSRREGGIGTWPIGHRCA